MSIPYELHICQLWNATKLDFQQKTVWHHIEKSVSKLEYEGTKQLPYVLKIIVDKYSKTGLSKGVLLYIFYNNNYFYNYFTYSVPESNRSSNQPHISHLFKL